MSVLIKDMKMPTSCMDCPFRGFDRVGERGSICTINSAITIHAVLDGMDAKYVHMGDCPLDEVSSAKWIWDDEGYHCSECWFHAFGDTLLILQGVMKYCPHCGARMDYDESEDYEK